VLIRQRVADKTAIGIETSEKLKTFSWKEEQKEKLYLPYVRVLVVDDVPTNHAVARGIMRPYRMSIDTALSGPEAIDLIEKAETHYDVIFMDHMMPGMDGIEAAKHIRKLGTDYALNIPIIALTANASPGVEELFFANGFNAYMAKPINTNVLNSILNRWVRDEAKDALYGAEPPEEELAQSGAFTVYNIDGVDLTAGAEQFGGEENYLEIVKVFVNDTPKLLKDVQNFLDGFRVMPAATAVAAAALDSLKNYTIAVHGIKGSCYGIFAATVGDLAKELEIAAKAQDLGKVLELNNRFIQDTEVLVEKLKVLFPKKEMPPRISKEAPDPAVMQKLLEAAQAYNINAMFETLNELEKYEYQEGEYLVQQLRRAADNYEYTDVISLLAVGPETGNSAEIHANAAG
jgi:CheY-like chemotaxis protein